MSKLDKLEQSLKQYKELLENSTLKKSAREEMTEYLEKAMSNYSDASGMPSGTTGGAGAPNTTFDVEKQEDGKEEQIEEADEAKEELEEEDKNKKMIEKELDEHNEDKHGEDKNADTAMKTELVKFDDKGQWSINK